MWALEPFSSADSAIGHVARSRLHRRPTVDSAAVVSFCPNTFATEVPMVYFEPSNLLCTRNEVTLQAADGNERRVNFEVTDATRQILSVRTGAVSGATTICKPYGEEGSSETGTQF